MARICARCRQPVSRRPDDHDCPVNGELDGSQSEDGEPEEGGEDA